MQYLKKIKEKIKKGWGRYTIFLYTDVTKEFKKVNLNFFIMVFPFFVFFLLLFIFFYDRILFLFQKEEIEENYKKSELLIYSLSLSLENKKKVIQSLEKKLTKLLEMQKEKQKSIKKIEISNSLQHHYVIEREIYAAYTINQQLKHFFFKESNLSLGPLWYKSYIYKIIPKGIPMFPGTFTISSGYGEREDPVFKGVSDFHYGLDFASGANNPILSISDGIVIKIMNEIKGGYGYYIQIHHGLGFKTLYAHCSEILAKEQQFIKRKDIIALVGKTGKATGNHLHYEVSIGLDKPINPLPFIRLK
ncbi:MAG: M23 family metallopeptidase [Leptonema sp. (in: bacteria)]